MRFLKADKYCTLTEASELYGVTRQRMHELVATYGAELTTLDRPRIHLIAATELRKIPVRRVNGKKSPYVNQSRGSTCDTTLPRSKK